MPAPEVQIRRDSRLFAEMCTTLLRLGHRVKFRASGQSMQPNLQDGDTICVAPVGAEGIGRSDIALVENADGLRVHRIQAISASSGWTTRGDTGQQSDPTARRLFGKVVAVSSNGRERPLGAWQLRIVHPWAALTRRMFLSAKHHFAQIFRIHAALLVVLACAGIFASSAYAQTADLSLTQTVNATTVSTTGTIIYTEVVTNNGGSTAVTPVLYQTTPPNTTFTSITTPTGWNCTANPGAGNTGTVTCTYTGNAGNYISGSTSTFTYTVAIATGTAAGTTIVNSANVTSSTADGTPQNNATTTTVLVESTADADLSLSMTASPSPVFINANFTYTIQLQNLGLNAGAGTNVVDTIPTGTTFVSAASTVGSCTQAAGVVTCTIGTLNSGSAATISIVVTSPSTAASLSNTATASTTTTDPVTTNNSSTVVVVAQPISCATPGRDSAATALTGVVNTYYPPSTATATLAAGAVTVNLGASSGAATPIAIGDLLLIFQTQAATINSTNTSSYGDGTPGDPATGSTALNGSGHYEFVTATRAVPTTGGILTFNGTGAGNGALNTYSKAPYGTNGQQTFQVIRVPQYPSVTIGAALSALAWNGSVGGVLAIDVAGQMNLNANTIDVSGLGFRGGAGRQLGGATGTLATDYVTLATTAANGSKGEGIAGTPRYVSNLAGTALTDTAVEGYPNGSYARGAPGNAGAGATDAHPTANDQNSGGGGGGNGGNGGYGGYGWNTAGVVGGHYGSAFPFSTSQLIFGGGGGAATTNDGTADPANANPAGINSSGAAGGGIVMIRAGSISGTGTIKANGQNALNVQNDGGGGGGAAGSIMVFTNSGTLTGLTANAIGGSGGNTWSANAPGAFPGNRHGPGGGGGGGAVLLSSTATAVSVLGGINGFTTTSQDAYGATPGLAGSSIATLTITQAPGTQSGAYCGGSDLSVTNAATPSVVLPSGTITYAQSVTNNGPLDAVNAIFTEAIPTNTTFQSISAAAGWSCSTPAVNGTGNITCTNPDVANGTTSNFGVVVKVNAGVTNGTQIVDVDNVTSGTSDPNLANNSATAITTVSLAASADLTVVNTASAPTVAAGGTVTMTGFATNQGPAVGVNVSFIEDIPTGATFNSLVAPAGWTCTDPAAGGTGTITCKLASFAVGATATFPVVLNIPAGTASGTVISDTATISAPMGDPNPTNNTSTATSIVASTGQVDLAVSTAGSPDPVTQGNNITYVQAVTNNGPVAETNATFTDTIPTNTTLFSFIAPANWTCNTILPGNTGTFTCTLNTGQTIASGASVSFPLVVKVNPATASGTVITNTVNVASTVGDPNSANNTASDTDVVASPNQADVSISKTASPEPVNQGTNLTYTIRVTNGGPAVAQGITVTDALPAQVTFTSVSSSQATCTGTTTVSCTIASLPVGGVALITINVSAVTFSSASLSTNTATVATSGTTDPNSANNTSSATSTIQSPTAVDIASFRAIAEPDGSVSLEWNTHEESRNLGFHLYRQQGAARERITPSLVAGSALLLRGSKPQHAAKQYRWIDRAPAAGAVYWIEDVDINGTRTLHGPASLEADSPAPDSLSAPAGKVSAGSPRAQLSPLLRELRAAAMTPAIRPVAPRPIFPVRPSSGLRFSAANYDAVKIAVDQEGWYHIAMADLLAAGLDANTDPRSLHLFAEGMEQPMLLTGGGNSSSSADAIEFYGTGIDTPFSADRVYWLIHENQFGKRILAAPAATSGTAAPTSFPFTVVRQDRITYFAALLNGEDNDNFFGATVTSDPVDQDLFAAHLDTSSTLPATLDVALQGVTDQQEHRVSVELNGASIGMIDFQGMILNTESFAVDASLLHAGSNTVTLTALEGDNDVSLIESIQLHYAHTYTADSDWLRATVPSGSEIQISGFSNSQIEIFDITDPASITQLGGKVTANAGAYNASVVLAGNGTSTRTILAVASDALSSPVSLAHHVPDSLQTQRSGADIVIVSNPEFAADLAPLVSLRESQGHHVALVTTDQLFDDYNYGERSPFAIRSFLSDASARWQLKPQSILLVGDASVDPRDYLGLGSFDFVPTRMIETAAFKTASDDWFTDFRSTGYGTIPTGRLPVRTSADTQLVVSKIVSYEQGVDAGPWNAQALLVADQNVNSNFTSASVSAASNLPSFLKVSQIFADGQDPGTVRSQLLAALNSGSLLVNYQGHGAEQQWSFVDLFDTNDAAALTNGGRLPVYLLMDCLNGLFQDVYAQSLAESILLAPNGGGVAVWASSGFTDQSPQASMNQALLSQFAAHPSDPLGLLILRAKSGTTDDDVRRTWILFGDPAMKLNIAASSPALKPSTSPAQAPPRTPVSPARPTLGCGTQRVCAQRKVQ